MQDREEAMATVAEVRKRWAWITGIRAVLMLLAGLFAVIFPAAALTVLVIAGGALLVVDGILGLWSLTFGGAKTGNFWFDVVRNALALILGVLILLSPIMATLLTATFLIYVIAFQAIIVGVMEIVVVLRERQMYARIWPVLLSGILYVLYGVVLLFEPLMGAIFMVIFGGVLAILFSIALFALAFRLNRAGNEAS
jgi:uncharacterized membrane protein HdeD (DUF308 family)